MSQPCLHPSMVALASRVAARLPKPLSNGLPHWLARRLPALNHAAAQAFGNRLQLVELFAGIGGLGAGLEAALGAVTVLQAEREPGRRAVLRQHFPLSLQLDDVHAVLELPPPTPPEQLIVAGGFPCRGASRANLTGQWGMAHPETGLWAVMAELVRRWEPRAVVFENVISLRSRGLDRVLSDLSAAGYSVFYGRLAASDLGAPHERARMFGIAIRRDLPSVSTLPRPLNASWMPWAGPLPDNDFDSEGRAARAAALGDAVLPVVAYVVGLVAAQLLTGWRPRPGTPANLADPPVNGWLADGQLFALPASPFLKTAQTLAADVAHQRWVTVDQRLSAPGLHLEDCLYPPMLGRIVWWDGISDNVDVEVPGGEVIPFPPDWIKHGPWPTPLRSDGRNCGATGQYHRCSVPLNALAQANEWIVEDGLTAAQLLEHYAGRGVGPEFMEWMMGFPKGWTGEIPFTSKPHQSSDVETPAICSESVSMAA